MIKLQDRHDYVPFNKYVFLDPQSPLKAFRYQIIFHNHENSYSTESAHGAFRK